jgi:Protein of unknown function (DUF3828)
MREAALSQKQLFRVILVGIAVLSTCPAPAQDLVSAKAFLASVYRHYGHDGEGISQAGPEAGKYFHSSLIALMQADVKAAGDEIPIADSDLMCDCQDWDGIYELKIDLHPQGQSNALADISFALDDEKHRDKNSWRKLKVILAPEHGQWRIYDIQSYAGRETPFRLRDAIRKDIQSYAQSAKANATH